MFFIHDAGFDKDDPAAADQDDDGEDGAEHDEA